MADRSRKWAQNVPGAFYVDDACIDCNLCAEIAPEHFAVAAEAGHDFVRKQPASAAERALCQKALESCPVGAIGDDGEEP